MTAYKLLCDEKENESAIPVYIQLALGALGNILAVIILFVGRHEHQWQSFYIFFTGLVLTDLVHNGVCYPLVLLRYSSDFTWCFSVKLCNFHSFMETFSHLASGMIIGAMTLDRYLYLRAIRKQTQEYGAQRKPYLASLFAIILLASILSSFHLLGLGNSQLYYPGTWCFLDFTDSSIGNKINAGIYSVFGLCIMMAAFVIGVKTIVVTCRNSEYQALLLDHHRVTGVYDSHVRKFLVISMVTFLLLWSPLLFDILFHICGLSETNSRKELWLIRLMYLNTQINPWLYVILRRESLRRFFVLILKCKRCLCEKEEQTTGQDSQDSGFYQ